MAARVLSVFVVALVARTLLAEQVTFQACPEPENYSEESNEAKPHSWNCTVNQVMVTPCAEATSNSPCRLKRGKSASIEIDYTPAVASEALTGRAYWTTAAADLPLLGMNLKACQFTECPLQPNHRQRYAYNLTIDKSFQPRSYEVKWRLFQEDVLDCCVIFKIKLTR